MQNLYNPDPEDTEPLLSVATITAAGAALLGLAVAFGLHLTDTQEKALLGVVAVVAPLVAAWLGRRRAYSPATVAKLLRR